MSNDLEEQIAFNWQGDLDDDCGAYHDNLLLRAEQMDTDRWWWAVNVRSESGRYDVFERRRRGDTQYRGRSQGGRGGSCSQVHWNEKT